VFGNNHVSGSSSQKKNVPYIRQHAYCTFRNCCKFIVSARKDQHFDETVNLQIVIMRDENHGRPKHVNFAEHPLQKQKR